MYKYICVFIYIYINRYRVNPQIPAPPPVFPTECTTARGAPTSSSPVPRT